MHSPLSAGGSGFNTTLEWGTYSLVYDRVLGTPLKLQNALLDLGYLAILFLFQNGSVFLLMGDGASGFLFFRRIAAI